MKSKNRFYFFLSAFLILNILVSCTPILPTTTMETDNKEESYLGTLNGHVLTTMDLSTSKAKIVQTYGVGVILDNGETVEAYLPNDVINIIMKDIRVRVVPEPVSIPDANKTLGWMVVEILPDGVPTPDATKAAEAKAQQCKLRGAFLITGTGSSETLDALATMIFTATGCEVDFLLVNRDALPMAMMSGDVDFALASFSEYLIIQEYVPLNPLFIPSYDTFSGFHRGAFFVPSDSNAQSLMDLAGKSFAYTAKGQGYGYLLPRIMIADNSYNVNNFFANTIPAGNSVIDMINAVLDGNADAGTVWWLEEDNGLKWAQAEIPDIMEQVKIIDYTDWIPSNVLFIRGDLPEDWQTALKEALWTIIQSDEGKDVFLQLQNITGLNDSDERFWNAVDLIQRAKSLDQEFGSW